MQYRCPAKPRFHGDIEGCGRVFDGEPDHEGLVDCPHCGIWFNPDKEPDGARAEIETRAYSDGSTATGVAPLPNLSPAQQDSLEATGREARQLGAINEAVARALGRT